MTDQLIFWGLFQVEKHPDKATQEKRRVLLTDVDQGHLQQYLLNEVEYENRRRQGGMPFFKSIQITTGHYYVLAIRTDANSNMNNTLKGIEDHIREHLSQELPDEEWKRRAIKILLTWNISEKRELENFVGNIKDIEIQQRNYGLIALVLAALTLVAILWMKK